jgi:hypothetical protein
LAVDVPYWIVLEKTADPAGGRLVIDTGATVNAGTLLVLDPSPTPTWRAANGAIWLRGYSSGTVTTNPLWEAEDTSNMSFEVGEDEFVVYTKTAGLITLGGSTDTILLRLRAELDANNTAGALSNGSTGLIHVSLQSNNAGIPSGTTVATCSSVQMNSLTSNFANYIFTLNSSLAAGTYWVLVSLSEKPVKGNVSICKKGRPITYMAVSNAETGTFRVQAGQPWVKSYLASPIAYASFNRDTTDVSQSLPGPNSQRTYIGVNQTSPTYKVEGFWAYNFTRFDKPKQLTLYPRAAYDRVTQQWVYVQFNSACYVVVRLLRGSTVITKFIDIPAAPGWRASFWQKNVSTYQTIDTTTPMTLDELMDDINLNNYYASGALQPYYNAQFEGYFTPKFNEAYSLTVTSSGGCQVFVNGVSLLNTLLAPVNFPSPISLGTLSNTSVYHFVIQYYTGDESQF